MTEAPLWLLLLSALAGGLFTANVRRRARRRQAPNHDPVAPPFGTEWSIQRRTAHSRRFSIRLLERNTEGSVIVVASTYVDYLDEIRPASKRLVRAYEKGLPW